MSIRNEIKAQIVRAGFTMQELVDRLAETLIIGKETCKFSKGKAADTV